MTRNIVTQRCTKVIKHCAGAVEWASLRRHSFRSGQTLSPARKKIIGNYICQHKDSQGLLYIHTYSITVEYMYIIVYIVIVMHCLPRTSNWVECHLHCDRIWIAQVQVEHVPSFSRSTAGLRVLDFQPIQPITCYLEGIDLVIMKIIHQYVGVMTINHLPFWVSLQARMRNWDSLWNL